MVDWSHETTIVLVLFKMEAVFIILQIFLQRAEQNYYEKLAITVWDLHFPVLFASTQNVKTNPSVTSLTTDYQLINHFIQAYMFISISLYCL